MSLTKKYFLNYFILLLPVFPFLFIFSEYMYLGSKPFSRLLLYLIYSGCLAFFICFKSMRNLMVRKPYTIKNMFFSIVALPVALNFIVGFVINFLRYIPYFFGSNKVIDIAAGQSVSEFSPYSIQDLIFNCFFVSVYEETLFKFFPVSMVILITLCFIGLRHCKLSFFRKSKRVMFLLLDKIRTNKYNKINVFFAIIVSIVFALSHKPDYSNFYVYFIPGLVNSLLFIKYGFVSAVVGHMSFNYLSLACFKIGTFIFGLFLI